MIRPYVGYGRNVVAAHGGGVPTVPLSSLTGLVLRLAPIPQR